MRNGSSVAPFDQEIDARHNSQAQAGHDKSGADDIRHCCHENSTAHRTDRLLSFPVNEISHAHRTPEQRSKKRTCVEHLGLRCHRKRLLSGAYRSGWLPSWHCVPAARHACESSYPRLKTPRKAPGASGLFLQSSPGAPANSARIARNANPAENRLM